MRQLASGLFNIVKKEFKEMVRDPRLLLGMIIVPLIMFPVMGAAMSVSVSSMEESTRDIDLGVVDLDSGIRSTDLIDLLTLRGVYIFPRTGEELAAAVNGTAQNVDANIDLYIVIDSNFTSDIENYTSATVTLVTPMTKYSMSESIPTDLVAGYIAEYQQDVLDERIDLVFPGQNSTQVQIPLTVSSVSIIKNEVKPVSPSQVANQMMTQSIMMPMVLMILLIMAAQLAATSVAMEKEEKTLETLLTTPVPRSSILFGKIAGVVLVSAIAVVAYVFGFSFYMSSVTSMSAGEASMTLSEMGLTPSPVGMALLLVTLFLSLISALSVAVLVASFTEDVRSAQSLMGILYVPILIPALVLMFVDISQLPGIVQTVVMAIPFSYPAIASKAIYTGDYFFVIIGIIYQVLFTAITIYLASRLFSSEKILTARFSLRRKGRSKFPILNAVKFRKSK